MKKFFIISSFVFIGFLPMISHGAELSQLTYTASSTACGGMTQSFGQTLGENIYGTPQELRFAFQPCSTFTGEVGVTLFDNTRSSFPGGTNQWGYGESNTYTAGQTYIISAPIGYSGIMLDPFDEYSFRVYSITGNNIAVVGSASNVFPNGSSTDGTNGVDASPVQDLYFEFTNTGYDPITEQATGSIAIITPADGSEVYDFNFFKIHATSSVGIPLIGVRYSASSTAILNATNFVWANTGGYRYSTSTGETVWEDFTRQSTGTSTASYDTFVYKSQNLVVSVNDEGVKYAKAFLYKENVDNIIASSTMSSFKVKFVWDNTVVGELTTSTLDAMLASSSLYLSLEDCPDDIWNALSVSGLYCRALNFAKSIWNTQIRIFTNVMASLGNLATKIFPINIFYHIHKAFVEAKPLAYSDIYLPVGGVNVMLFDSATIQDATNAISFPYRKIVDYIMYLVTFLYAGYASFLALKFIKNQTENK